MEYRPEGRGHRGRVLGLRDLVEALWQCSSRVNAEQGKNRKWLTIGVRETQNEKVVSFLGGTLPGEGD